MSVRLALALMAALPFATMSQATDPSVGKASSSITLRARIAR